MFKTIQDHVFNCEDLVNILISLIT